MKRIRLRIRDKLLVGTVLVLLPFLAQNILWFEEASARREEAVLLSLRQSAELAGVVVDRAFDGALDLARSVAVDAESDAFNRAETRRWLQRLARVRADVANLALANPEGETIVAAIEGDNAPPRIADREYFQRALQTRKPGLSNMLRGRAMGEPIVVATYPLEKNPTVALVGLRLSSISEPLEVVQLRKGQDVFLVDPTGKLAFHTAEPEIAAEDRAVMDRATVREVLQAGSSISTSFPALIGSTTRVAALVKTRVHGWVVGVSWERTAAFGALRRERRQQIALFALISLVSLGGAWALAEYLTARLRRLAKMMEQFRRGELAIPLGDDELSRDEVDELTRCFEAMARALSDEQMKRETFVSGVAHELRNVVAPLLLTAQLMKRNVPTADADKLLDRVLMQIGRINRLVTDLLDAARIQSGRFAISPERVDVTELVRRAIEEQRLVAPEQVLRLEGPASAHVKADEDRILQVISNLLGNAVKHGGEGSEILVRVSENDAAVEVCVDDTGRGMTEAEARALFQPYSRLERGRDRPGMGLGLFISRGIVEAHGGVIRVEPHGPGGGATFCFRLPKHRAPRSG